MSIYELYGLNSLTKGVIWGLFMGVAKGDTRSLDYGSNRGYIGIIFLYSPPTPCKCQDHVERELRTLHLV